MQSCYVEHDVVDGDARLHRIMEVIQRLAAGDFDVEAPPAGKYDEYDAVMIGLGMLAEELAANTVSIAAYQEKVEALEAAQDDVRTLSEMLPMCAWCKKLRDDEGYWKQLETYVAENFNTRITHGMCPDCAKKFE